MKKFTEYIGSQFGNPRGIVGKLCCQIMNAINRAMYRGIVTSVQPDGPWSLLDIGYGNGYLIHELSQKPGLTIFGIDLSEDMKRAAEKRNRNAVNAGNVILSLGDCCRLAFESGSFDAVTTVNTIYFWSDPATGMSEIFRVLKSSGVFYNAVYSKEWLQTLSYTKKGFRFFDREELLTLGKEAGFSEVSIREASGGKSYLVQYRK